MKNFRGKVDLELLECMDLHLIFNTNNLTAWHMQPISVMHALTCLSKIKACSPNQLCHQPNLFMEPSIQLYTMVYPSVLIHLMATIKSESEAKFSFNVDLPNSRP